MSIRSLHRRSIESLSPRGVSVRLEILGRLLALIGLERQLSYLLRYVQRSF